MFIEQIYVEKFKKLRNFTLKFPDSKIMDLKKDKKMRLSVIIGENGTAKTTIFQLLINSFINENNTENGNYEVTFLLKGNEYSKTNYNDIYNDLPLNIVVSSYTPIDKLDFPKTNDKVNGVNFQKII